MTVSIVDIKATFDNELAATNDADVNTGIAAGGGFHLAPTAINMSTGATTLVAVGDGVNPVESTKLSGVVNNIKLREQIYRLDLVGMNFANNRPHVLTFTNIHLNLSNSEAVFEFNPVAIINFNTNLISGTTVSLPWSYNFDRKRLFMTLSHATATALGNNKLLLINSKIGRI